MTAAQSIDAIDDIIGCTLDVDDLLGSAEQIAPLDPLPCPVTIAWSGTTPLIPVSLSDKIARERFRERHSRPCPGSDTSPWSTTPALWPAQSWV